ncbi:MULTISPECIES: hypothetical protein [Kitasatospora]|uniref:Uncharacterized protein n=1 Tax=Kitasatospora cystarginea TaxID=58350 RepID=A0ABN3EZD9_9ACTN
MNNHHGPVLRTLRDVAHHPAATTALHLLLTAAADTTVRVLLDTLLRS